nr:MAG TPA: hypothetical protein [Bacteriophage sp.]
MTYLDPNCGALVGFCNLYLLKFSSVTNSGFLPMFCSHSGFISSVISYLTPFTTTVLVIVFLLEDFFGVSSTFCTDYTFSSLLF